jgi:hypothetical protein
MAIDRPSHGGVTEHALVQLRPASWSSRRRGPLGNGRWGRGAGDFAPARDCPGAAHRCRLPVTLFGV